jgi:hypothetical protein
MSGISDEREFSRLHPRINDMAKAAFRCDRTFCEYRTFAHGDGVIA